MKTDGAATVMFTLIAIACVAMATVLMILPSRMEAQTDDAPFGHLLTGTAEGCAYSADSMYVFDKITGTMLVYSLEEGASAPVAEWRPREWTDPSSETPFEYIQSGIYHFCDGVYFYFMDTTTGMVSLYDFLKGYDNFVASRMLEIPLSQFLDEANITSKHLQTGLFYRNKDFLPGVQGFFYFFDTITGYISFYKFDGYHIATYVLRELGQPLREE